MFWFPWLDEIFGLGFEEKNSIVQEHEVLFRVCVNDVVFELLSEMDIWEIILFWETRKIYFVCVLDNFLVCGLCYENVLVVQNNDFGN